MTNFALNLVVIGLAVRTAGAGGPATAQAAPPVTMLSDIAKSLEWVGPAVSEPDYYVWCTSPIDGPDGRTHLFVLRWPKSYKMGGWTRRLRGTGD